MHSKAVQDMFALQDKCALARADNVNWQRLKDKSDYPKWSRRALGPFCRTGNEQYFKAFKQRRHDYRAALVGRRAQACAVVCRFRYREVMVGFNALQGPSEHHLLGDDDNGFTDDGFTEEDPSFNVGGVLRFLCGRYDCVAEQIWRKVTECRGS